VEAAVAVGALELLRRDELNKRHNSEEEVVITDTDDRHHHRHCHDTQILEVSPKYEADHDPPGHKRRLAEEIVRAYSLGQEIMGHKKHHVAHVVAEVLGAVAAMNDTGDHVHGME
jgi:hypothetical protein